MVYDLERALKTAAKIGVVGLGATIYGNVVDNEILQNLGYITMGASATGATLAGIRGLIDRNRPTDNSYSKDHDSATSSVRELSPREIYNRDRKQQEYRQKLDFQGRVRQTRYDRKRAIAITRIRQGGVRGAAWRAVV